MIQADILSKSLHGQTRVTKETQVEQLKQWLGNIMGGDRQ